MTTNVLAAASTTEEEAFVYSNHCWFDFHSGNQIPVDNLPGPLRSIHFSNGTFLEIYQALADGQWEEVRHDYSSAHYINSDWECKVPDRIAEARFFHHA